jgi:hypothetical protein
MAASQSVLASKVTPSLMLMPAVTNLLVKSSPWSQLPQSMSRPVPASKGWIPRAPAVVQVVPDFLEPASLGRIRPQERARDTSVLMDAR